MNKTDDFDKLLAEFDRKIAKFYAKRRKANKLLLNIRNEVAKRELQINRNGPKLKM